jgi:angio-associated migratory cell protein
MSEEYEVVDVSDDDYERDSSMGDEDDVQEGDQGDDDNDTSFFSAQFPDSALCIGVSPVDPFRMCVGCLDNTARIIVVDEVGAPQQPISLEGHTDSVVSVGFSYNGEILATGSYDCSIRTWTKDGTPLATIEETGSDIETILWHPSVMILSAGCADGSVWVWDVLPDTGECILKYMLRGHSHGAGVRGMEYFGKNGMALLTASEEGVSIVWNLQTGQVVHKTKVFTDPVVCLSCHPSKPIYALGLENGTTYIIHGESGKVLHKIGQKGSVESVRFSPCGFLLAVATLEGVLEIWTVEQLGGYPRHRIDLAALKPESENGFTKIIWHPDPTMRCVVSVGKSGAVHLWNAMTGEHVTELTGNQADIMDVAMTQFKDPQGRDVARIITACDEGFVRMFTVSEEN